MKRPSFQFYPSDWLRDTALRSCSTGARGLWIDMICFMHEGNPYGYLKVGNKVILAENLARMVGLTIEEVEDYLAELKEANVFDFDADGAIYSRRMIRDENLRNIRASGGKLGGNPALMSKNKVNLKDNQKVENEVNQNPTPSSSSSSSSSSSNKEKSATVVACPPDVDQQIWEDWKQLRKAKKAPVTQTVVDSARKEALIAEMEFSAFLSEWCARGSQGLKAEWIKPKNAIDQSNRANLIAGGY